MNVSSTEEIEQLKAGQPNSFTQPKSGSSYTLPDEPVVTIQPSKKWVAINLRDLWAYRDLLYFSDLARCQSPLWTNRYGHTAFILSPL